MILVDALYINNSGGKILLDYLIESLEATDVQVFYLLDKRIEDKHPVIKSSNSFEYLEASLLLRHKFYKQKKNDFAKVICFGNLPPTVKLNAQVYTYFHQKLFLNVPDNFTIKLKIVWFLKTKIFQYLHQYTDYWLVQSSLIKDEFLETFKSVQNNQVLIIPFYPEFKENATLSVDRNRYGFVYVSSGEGYKNHKRLLEAFSTFYENHKFGELHLTISSDYEELTIMIDDLISKGYPIYNYGFLARTSLELIYLKNTFCIYPSLTESFGLGIVEAIDKGCKIIGADLPYTYAVCQPSLTFNPLEVDSILSSLERSLLKDIPPTDKILTNKINELIAIVNK